MSSCRLQEEQSKPPPPGCQQRLCREGFSEPLLLTTSPGLLTQQLQVRQWRIRLIRFLKNNCHGWETTFGNTAICQLLCSSYTCYPQGYKDNRKDQCLCSSLSQSNCKSKNPLKRVKTALTLGTCCLTCCPLVGTTDPTKQMQAVLGFVFFNPSAYCPK